MNMENEELKPCPFCGGKAEIFGHTASWGAMCTKCGSCNRQGSKTEAEAIKKWNNRADLNYSVFPNSSKLTYADVEKMVKPLEWDRDTATLRLDGCFEVVFRAERSGQSDMFAALIELEDNVFTLECGLAEEDVKPVLQEFLVDIVAAALGVERSGE